MSQAMNSAMSGMNAGQQQITVASDNIANLNTTAYKESSMNFQDIFYQTKTAGTQGTGARGGTNPMQIGFGTIASSITKNFEPSTINTTGRTTDMALQGPGFFTLVDQDGLQYLTRAGNFSLDGNGFLTAPNGMMVLGTSNSTSYNGSKVPIRIPEAIQAEPKPREVGSLAGKNVVDLNATILPPISGGTFTVDAIVNNTKKSLEITIPDVTNMTMQEMVTEINKQLTDGDMGVTCTLTDGAIRFNMVENVAGDTPTELKFTGGTSTFVQATGISVTPLVPAAGGVPAHYDTDTLDYTVDVNPVSNANDAISKKSFTISDQGTIQITYSNGDKISVYEDPKDGTRRFQYLMSNGVKITGADCKVDPNILKPENLQLQFVNIANPEGLVATGANMYTTGPNSGRAIYSAASSNGVGALRTGGLEASNVDMSRQFSNMILAQRAIEANSRVFDTANTVLQTLVYLGRG